jgi:Ca-activated chloride channel family protein
MNIELFHIFWEINWLIVFFISLPITISFFVFQYVQRNKTRSVLGLYNFSSISTFDRIKRIAKHIIHFIGLLFLCITLLQPKWNKKEETVKQRGRDLFIALDISRSMLAQDCAPDRLMFAKQKIKKLVKLLSSERIGLLLFSGTAFVQCPLTQDYAAFEMFLDQVDVETISFGTTAIDKALTTAIQAFGDENRKHRLLVLCTDGEDFSQELDNVQKQAKQKNMKIFAFGIGSPEGAPIPLYDQLGNNSGHQKNHNGKIVITRLDEQRLNSLVSKIGGKYVRGCDDDRDVQMIVHEIELCEKQEIADRKSSSLEHQYPWFLIASFICYGLAWLL